MQAHPAASWATGWDLFLLPDPLLDFTHSYTLEVVLVSNLTQQLSHCCPFSRRQDVLSAATTTRILPSPPGTIPTSPAISTSDAIPIPASRGEEGSWMFDGLSDGYVLLLPLRGGLRMLY